MPFSCSVITAIISFFKCHENIPSIWVEDPLTEGARARTNSLPFTEATVNILREEDATCDVLGCICEER